MPISLSWRGLKLAPKTPSATPTEGISDGRGVTGLQNVLAADVPREKTDLANLDVERALASAPRRDGQFIEVRAVLGGESGEA